MCRRILPPGARADFGLTEITFDMVKKAVELAKKEGRPKPKIKPGFIAYALNRNDNGFTEEEMSKIVLWKNAHKTYLGVNYDTWSWRKKTAADLRIVGCFLWRRLLKAIAIAKRHFNAELKALCKA